MAVGRKEMKVSFQFRPSGRKHDWVRSLRGRRLCVYLREINLRSQRKKRVRMQILLINEDVGDERRLKGGRGGRESVAESPMLRSFSSLETARRHLREIQPSLYVRRTNH